MKSYLRKSVPIDIGIWTENANCDNNFHVQVMEALKLHVLGEDGMIGSLDSCSFEDCLLQQRGWVRNPYVAHRPVIQYPNPMVLQNGQNGQNVHHYPQG